MSLCVSPAAAHVNGNHLDDFTCVLWKRVYFTGTRDSHGLVDLSLALGPTHTRKVVSAGKLWEAVGMAGGVGRGSSPESENGAQAEMSPALL